jgi:hypothetical protein
MNLSDDPLLRAIVDGDSACPDGEKLVALGKLIKSASTPRATDLVGDVLARIDREAVPAEDESLEDAADAFCTSGVTGNPELTALFRLVQAAAELPHPVDLVARVEKAIGNGPRQSQPITLDAGSHWRIWSAVVAGHVAALIAIFVYQFGFEQTPDRDDPEYAKVSLGDGGKPTATPTQTPIHRTPVSWNTIGAAGFELFAPRRSASAREKARHDYGMADSAEAIAQALAWLQAQQREDGHFGDVLANPDRDLAVQSLVALALLGEGLGDETRLEHARRGLFWIRAQADRHGRFAECSPVTNGMIALALVEGGVLLDDPHLRMTAENTLAGLGTLPLKPEASGLGGFALIALEIASHCDLAVPSATLAAARRDIGRSAPAAGDAIGRIGLAAFASRIDGNDEWTRHLGQIAGMKPELDRSGRADALSWIFPSLAMRECGGSAWDGWSQALQATLLGQFSHAEGLAWVSADKVRYADTALTAGDIFATSLVLINLQSAYRYVTLSH